MPENNEGTLGHIAGRHEPLLAPEDVAAILGVPVGTLYQWRYQRKGPRALRVGRHLRYRQRDIEEFIAGRLLDSSS